MAYLRERARFRRAVFAPVRHRRRSRPSNRETPHRPPSTTSLSSQGATETHSALRVFRAIFHCTLHLSSEARDAHFPTCVVISATVLVVCLIAIIIRDELAHI